MGPVVAAVTAVTNFIVAAKSFAAGIGAFLKVSAYIAAGVAVYDRYRNQQRRRGLPTTTVNIRAAAQPATLIYGEYLSGGVISFIQTKKQISVTEIHDLHVVLIHSFRQESLGGTEGIQSFIINNHEFTAPKGAADGSFTSSWFLRDDDLNTQNEDVLQLQWMRPGGRDVAFGLDDYPDTREVLGTLSRDTFGKDLCFSAWRFEKRDASLRAFSAGLPNIAAKIRGCKLYDPRKDGTNGGTDADNQNHHRLNDATTWEWSSNPALAIVDYLVNYVGYDADNIDWTSIRAAADHCDVEVMVDADTQKRWTCNIALPLDGDARQSNLEKLLETCGGTLIRVGGKYKLEVFHPRTIGNNLPVIKEEHIMGTVEQESNRSTRERFNKVKGTYMSPDDGWELTDFADVADANLRARDGQDLDYDITLEGVTVEEQCERLAHYHLANQGRDQSLTLGVPFEFIELTVGDFVHVEYPPLFGTTTSGQITTNVQKLFRVEAVTINTTNSPLQLQLREFDSTAFHDPAANGYEGKRTGTIQRTRLQPDAPHDFRAEAVSLEAVKFSWRRPYETDEAILYTSYTNDFADATEQARGYFDSFVVDVPLRRYVYGWVQVQRRGQLSLKNPNLDTTNVYALPLDPIDSLNVNFVYQAYRIVANLNFNTARGSWGSLIGQDYNAGDIVLSRGIDYILEISAYNWTTPMPSYIWRCVAYYQAGHYSQPSYISNVQKPGTLNSVQGFFWNEVPNYVSQYTPIQYYNAAPPIATSDINGITYVGDYPTSPIIYDQYPGTSYGVDGQVPYLAIGFPAHISAVHSGAQSFYWFTDVAHESVIEFHRQYSSKLASPNPSFTFIRWTGERPQASFVPIYCMVEKTDGTATVWAGTVRGFYSGPIPNRNNPYVDTVQNLRVYSGPIPGDWYNETNGGPGSTDVNDYVGRTAVLLTWDAVIGPSDARYETQYRAADDPNWTISETALPIAIGSGGTDTITWVGGDLDAPQEGLTPNTEYVFRVRAINPGNEWFGRWSNELRVTTDSS